MEAAPGTFRLSRWGESLWFPTIHEDARPEGVDDGGWVEEWWMGLELSSNL